MHFCKAMVAAFSLMLLWAGSAAAADNDALADMKKAAREIGEYSVEQKEAAVAKAKELMDKLDARLEGWEEDLEEKMAGVRQSTKENTRESKKQLRRQRNELSEWYGRMKDSSTEAWRDVKEGFSAAYDSVVDSWQQADRQIDGDRQ